MTTRFGTGTGATGAVGVSGSATVESVAEAAGVEVSGAATIGAGVATGLVATGATAGFATAGATTGAATMGAATGVCVVAGAAGAATITGGFAITGPTGGLLAIAGGAGAGVTIRAPWLGSGTIRRGAGTAGATTAATGAFGCETGFATVTTLAAGTADGGAATAVGRGGWLRASASACLRSRIALSASPGFDTCDRLNAGFESVCGFGALLREDRLLK
jgi:hypothetical protein